MTPGKTNLLLLIIVVSILIVILCIVFYRLYKTKTESNSIYSAYIELKSENTKLNKGYNFYINKHNALVKTLQDNKNEISKELREKLEGII